MEVGMAIWQFEMAFLPAGTDSLIRTNRGFDLTPLDEHAIASVQLVLESRMGRACPDVRGTVSYGDPEGNRIDLIDDGHGKREIWVSIDATSDADRFCKLICLLAQALDCELFSPEFEIRLSPDLKLLSTALMKSQAWTFALDPSRFKQTAYGWLPLP
jgi:hypothetical protein